MTAPGEKPDTPDLPDEIARLGFEEAYQALEEAVEQLEKGELSLEESLKLHEKGVALSRRCDELLTRAELRVKEIDAEGGEVGDLEL